MPIAHGEGNYHADPELLSALEGDGRVVFRYCDADGSVTSAANPNGSVAGIAGICDERGNVVALMPHPERCSEAGAGRHRRRGALGIAAHDRGGGVTIPAPTATGPILAADAAASAPDDATLREVALTRREYDEVRRRLGRDPNPLELGIIGGMWSEHCSYKHSRALLRRFPTEGDRVLLGAGEENAGAIDIGDGLAIVMKVESHNHPSAVEPFQGAATGVGGILRDIFTMGARPIALLDSLRFGSLDNARSRHLANGRHRRDRLVRQLRRRADGRRRGRGLVGL